MARQHNARTGNVSSRPQQQQEERGGLPGGAAGLPASEVPARMQPNSGPADGKDRTRQAKRFMVVDGPRDGSGKIRFHDKGSGMVSLLPGREVTDATHDLSAMRKQSIRLEAIPDEVVEEEHAEQQEDAAPPEDQPPGEDATA